MRIQVTNDDGIESEGLQVLARRLAETEHEVIVVAPDRDWSGAGAALGSISPNEGLAASRVTIDDAPGLEAWALDGPPALTVIAAQLGAFGPAPDLEVSGINAGLNTGRTVLHSGTVGAVLTGQNFGISGLAVSVADSGPWHWETAAELAVEVLRLVINAPPRSALNLNVPARPRHEVAGIRWGRLAPFGPVRAAVGPVENGRLQFELSPTGYEPAPDTDQGLVNLGYASLTTLAGITEAWGVASDRAEDLGMVDLSQHIVPGADLHPVHRMPDGSAPHTLWRPLLEAR